MSLSNDGGCGWNKAKGESFTVKQVTIGMNADADIFFFVTQTVKDGNKSFEFTANEQLITDFSDEGQKAFVKELVEVMETQAAVLRDKYLK